MQQVRQHYLRTVNDRTKFPWSRIILTCGLIVWESTAIGRAQPTELLQRLPAGANALAVIDAKGLLMTELAIQEGWKEKRELGYGARPLMIPPEAEVIVIGALLDPDDGLSRVWESCVMRLSEPFSLRSIARAEGGYVDQIGSVDVVWTPSEAYIVNLEGGLLGMISPDSRQAAGRWIQAATANQPVDQSDYLREAVALAGPRTQVVMAIDLNHAVQPHRLREGLSASPSLANQPELMDRVAPVIASLRGLTLTMNVSNRIQGTLKFDFAHSVAPLGQLAKPLVLEALNRFQAGIPDLDRWNATLEDQSIILKGTLSTDGARRIGSLLQLPTTKFSDLKEVESPSIGTGDVSKSSQAYFRSVTALITDLRKSIEENRQRDNHALWMERYGRKIDALPILNVDEELVVWGAGVAETFRGTSVTQKSSAVRQGVRKSQVYGNYQYSGYADDGSYYNTYRTSQDVKTQINREEQARASAVRFENWKQIEDSTAEIRRRMTMKYQLEF